MSALERTIAERATTDGYRIERGIVVAGIPIEHELPVAWTLGDGAFPAWSNSRAMDAPLRLRHELGDGAGLHVVIDSPDTQETYYVDDAGELGVRFGARRIGETDQWLRTIDAGRRYALLYSAPEDAAMRQWRWQRTAVMYAIASRGLGVMAHATAFVTREGVGVLCPGSSGIGKSTFATQIAAALGASSVLSDDRVAVRVDDGGPRVWGTPWHSSAGYASGADAPLGAVVLLARSNGAPPSVRELSARGALPRLLRSLAAPFWSGPLMESMLDTLDAVLQRAPVIEFCYTPGPGVAEPLLRAIAGSTTVEG